MKRRTVGLLSLVVLAGEYLAVRFPLFSLHRMKDWPLFLLLFGVIIVAISGLAFGGRLLPALTAVGYMAGFIAGFLFQFDYGRELNSMWVIWTCVYLTVIFIGVIAEFGKKRAIN